jgi:DME family drug/metabolite transporter
MAATLWGTTGTAQAFAPPGATPLAVGGLRLAIGGVALLAVALLQRAVTPWPRLPWRALGIAILCMAAYQLFFFAGVARTGVAAGTVVGIGSAPVIAGLLGWAVDRVSPNRAWVGATLLAMTGVSLLAVGGGPVRMDPVGMGLALSAGAAYAVYTSASKRVVTAAGPAAAMALVFCGGALLLAPVLATQELRWLAAPRGMAVALHLGLVATGLAYVLFGRGLATTPAATAVTLSLAEPLTASLLGILVLREPVTARALFGMGLIFAGLGLLAAAEAAGHRLHSSRDRVSQKKPGFFPGSGKEPV